MRAVARTCHRVCPTAPIPRLHSTVARGAKDREAQLQWVALENRCCSSTHITKATSRCQLAHGACVNCCRQEVAQILDIAERAAQRWEISYTHFVTPPVAADALAAINQRADIKAVAWGGYPQAERCRVAIGKEEVMLTAAEDPSTLEDAVAALDLKGNFMFDPATHRDFLGAILGTGKGSGAALTISLRHMHTANWSACSCAQAKHCVIKAARLQQTSDGAACLQ